MAFTLTVETGAIVSGANSYASVADADDYFDGRLYSTPWQQAETPKKERALAWATQLLDERVSWRGTRVSTTQALRWPRSGVSCPDRDALEADDEIPARVKRAVYELALALMETDRVRGAERGGEVGASTRVGSRSFAADGSRGLALPPAALAPIRPYIHEGTAKLVRAA